MSSGVAPRSSIHGVASMMYSKLNILDATPASARPGADVVGTSQSHDFGLIVRTSHR